MVNNNVQSFYNEGFFQIQRLNTLWFEANSVSRTGDFQRWRWILDTVFRELSRDILKNENKTFKPNNQWYEDNPYYQTYLFHQERLEKSSKDGKLYYNALSDYEIYLRWLQDAFGKGGKYIDPDEHGID
jgi:hypothetical protein